MLFAASILVLVVSCSGQDQFTCTRATDDSSVISSRDIYNGYKQLGDGWVALFNGYQYKKTSKTATWHASRRICQSWNADLVVYGVQDFGTRSLLYRALSINGNTWIGLTDEASEGIWRWVNGRRAVNSALFWNRGQPDNAGNNEDCGHLWTIPSAGYLSSNDRPCQNRLIAVCEKPNLMTNPSRQIGRAIG